MTTRAAFEARLRALAGLQAGDSLLLVTDLTEAAVRASARRISAAFGMPRLFRLTAVPDGWIVTRRVLTRRQQLGVIRGQMRA